MRVVIQRVSESQVVIDKQVHASISNGLMVLLGFETEDDDSDLEWIKNKILNLRIFDDDQGVMNKNIREVNGELLLISQFTLHASTKKGNRPSYIKAARPETAIPLYERFIEICAQEIPTKSGSFGADMKVSLINDGPVTISIDSKDRQ